MKKYSLLLLPTLLLLATTDVHCMENINNTLNNDTNKNRPPFISELFSVNTMQQDEHGEKRKRIVKPTKNQPANQPLQKKRNTSLQSMTNATTTASSSSSSQSITTESSSSSSSTPNTWIGYPLWNQKKSNSAPKNFKSKQQTIEDLLENAGTSTEMPDEIKNMLNLETQRPRDLINWLFNPTKKSKISIIQQIINDNNTTGLSHLKFILNCLITKIHSLEKFPSRKQNYLFLANKLEECSTDNTTPECSELINNMKTAMKNIQKLTAKKKDFTIFKVLKRLLNTPTQQSNSLNISSSSQNQLLPAYTPLTQPQTTTTITHLQEMQQTQQSTSTNQPITNNQPLQKKQNTSQQSVTNSTTPGSNSSSSLSIAIGSSSSSSSTTNTWTGHPPSHWNKKKWVSLSISKKAQIIATLFNDAGTSEKMLNEIKTIFDDETQQPNAVLKWFFKPMKNSENSIVQQAINKNNPTGLRHLKFILNLVILKINSLKKFPNQLNNYQVLTTELKAYTTNNTAPEYSNLINNVIDIIENTSKDLIYKQRFPDVFNALNQLLNGPTQPSNSLNASQSQTTITILKPTAIKPSPTPQTTTTITIIKSIPTEPSTPPSNNQQSQPKN
ncbi:TPA: hypothetical protein DDZ86_00095 [Candidatus Dependentiae bacterium]|nr:MAG: LPXTG-motif protein cell wall anchor domain protein [candidate division TM6 bacterium GW2011_GWF2_43_87]HBL98028.1 hypothetical protein [Candidatus Dependentiae bacterium]